MSEKQPEGTVEQESTQKVGVGTDVGAAGLDVEEETGGDVPATSDPEQFTDDSTLGGTHGENAGGAG